MLSACNPAPYSFEVQEKGIKYCQSKGLGYEQLVGDGVFNKDYVYGLHCVDQKNLKYPRTY